MAPDTAEALGRHARALGNDNDRAGSRVDHLVGGAARHKRRQFTTMRGANDNDSYVVCPGTAGDFSRSVNVQVCRNFTCRPDASPG